jgi:hypothetical protein
MEHLADGETVVEFHHSYSRSQLPCGLLRLPHKAAPVVAACLLEISTQHCGLRDSARSEDRKRLRPSLHYFAAEASGASAWRNDGRDESGHQLGIHYLLESPLELQRMLQILVEHLIRDRRPLALSDAMLMCSESGPTHGICALTWL